MTKAATASQSELLDFVLSPPHPDGDRELLKTLSFLPGLQEVLMLRQVHALEHATVWVLSAMNNGSPSSSLPSSFESDREDNNTLGGLSTEKGFYLYGTVEKSHLRQAVSQALKRLQGGEWELAVHPRCGTNVSIALLLTGGLAAGSSLLLPRNPFVQMLGLGCVSVLATQLAPDLGELAQKYITTAIPFNLAIEEIVPTSDVWGRSAHFVRVRWQD